MISFREATMDDAKLLWEWANEKTVVENSYRNGKILWKDHVEWLKKVVKDRKKILLIAQAEDKSPIGQIRFDVEEKEATVSVSISKDQRGRGYGEKVIAKGSQHIINKTQISLIHAYIKKGNEASKKVFKNAGYEFFNEELVKGKKSYHYIYKK